MRQRIQISLSILMMALVYFPAQAQQGGNSNRSFYFEEAFFPEYVNRNDTGSVLPSENVATESGLGYDSRTNLGIILGRSLVIGATYNLYHLQTKRDAVAGGSDSLDETTSTEQWGPMVGWVTGNWRFLGTYFLSGKNTVETKNNDTSGALTQDVTITKTKMSGYQILIGYTFAVSEHFAFGPSVVYRATTYTTQSKVNRINTAESYDDTTLSTKSTEGTLKAMISLLFQF